MSKPVEPQFLWQDLSELAIGTCIIAFPLAARDEFVKMGAELSTGRILAFAAVSIILLSVVVHVIHHHDKFPLSHKAFIIRVASTYAVAFFISLAMLLGLDRVDFFEDPLTSFKTAILIAFPSSFTATAVDSFASRN
jgi:uncharacterized membrane protein